MVYMKKVLVMLLVIALMVPVAIHLSACSTVSSEESGDENTENEGNFSQDKSKTESDTNCEDVIFLNFLNSYEITLEALRNNTVHNFYEKNKYENTLYAFCIGFDCCVDESGPLNYQDYPDNTDLLNNKESPESYQSRLTEYEVKKY